MACTVSDLAALGSWLLAQIFFFLLTLWINMPTYPNEKENVVSWYLQLFLVAKVQHAVDP